ncbi:unnamed protein product [Acanthoscelides obtectus]|uniref:Uncharacterized protein n=1 Tax=Acanthoscelides obtectus TaxID=200917 RepID=A0A9P0K5I5_ACAOB|nr:unnamed protein product [Acanthoscelides obtectus]CAK1622868.1 hypothetical protein AOBTE_LOCUS1702 [Acanthoscelides obtectus]
MQIQPGTRTAHLCVLLSFSNVERLPCHNAVLLAEYVDYHSPERPRPIVPRNNLKTSGLFDSSIPEEKFTTKLQPLIPFLREPCDSRGGSRPTSAAGSRRGSLKEDRLIPTHNHNLI